MEDASNAGPASEPTTIVNAPADTPTTLSTTEAARILRSARKPPEEKPAAQATEPPQLQESTAQAEDATPAQEPPSGETEAQPEPAELPPIEPPRSWTKAEKEEFATYPRDAQEKIARREQERDSATRRSQNEAADKLKGLTAKEQAVEQARQHYESALPQLLQTLQNQQAGEFSDIRTIADVERMARDDFPRYVQWDIAQKKIAAVQQEVQIADQRKAQEKLQQFAEFASKQDALFLERVPEMADAAKAAELQGKAMRVLKDIGFDDTELAQSWNGGKDLSLRDHRTQLLIRDAMLWRDAQQKTKVATSKPVPHVVRPGVSQSRGAAADAEIRGLEQRLAQSGNVKDAAELLRARRAASR